MLQYTTRRLLYTVFVMFTVTLLVFMVIHVIPGDPVQVMLGDEYSEEAYEAWREEFGLNRPLHLQYVSYLGGVIRGDLGRSFRTRAPVLGELITALGPTLRLTFAALCVSVALGIPVGIFSAVKRGSVWDRLAMSVSVLGVSAPYFWVGLLLMYVFALQLGWFPAFGSRGGIRSLVLPAVTLGINYAAMLARISRSNMLEVLSQDYVRTALAKGLKGYVVVYKHALRNAALPIVTLVGLQMGFLISGSLIVETVFAWPGIGRMVIVAVHARDIPTIQGAVLFMGLFISMINLIVDLMYGVLDPRVQFA